MDSLEFNIEQPSCALLLEGAKISYFNRSKTKVSLSLHRLYTRTAYF
jgi:hypothetical protein